jgi:hypothetical protein
MTTGLQRVHGNETSRGLRGEADSQIRSHKPVHLGDVAFVAAMSRLLASSMVRLGAAPCDRSISVCARLAGHLCVGETGSDCCGSQGLGFGEYCMDGLDAGEAGVVARAC